MKERLVVFDTTLRDGEQSPGASMTPEDKVRIAQMLERMHVDVIEAGFPSSSDEDFASVRKIAETVENSIICGLAMATKDSIIRCADAVRSARRQRIHTFIATSEVHMRDKLRMSSGDVLAQAERAVRWARDRSDDVQFSPEDASRSDPDFLCRVIERVIVAGAGTINIPDTVGYSMPEEFGARIRMFRERVPNSDKVRWSVHCHDDLGMAVANSLSGVIAGARQVECTINGIGERAGNASFEEVVMAVKTRASVFPCETGIDTTLLVPASKMVASITKIPVQKNKAVVGANAFSHEAGIHQDGMIKNRETYEIMRPEDVGWRSSRIVLGKHSGRNAFREKLKKMKIMPSSADSFERAFASFKNMTEKKRRISEKDIRSIVSSVR